VSYKVLIEKDAQEDILATISWYNLQRSNLGDEYYQDFKNAVDYLAENPLLFRLRKLNTRKVRVSKRFPFFIHFVVEEQTETIKIFGVLHGSKRPLVWHNRIK
jgi:plasmid stabilization system protein ParE